MKYRIRRPFSIEVGFTVASKDISDSLELTNKILNDLPASLYRCLDFKTISAIIGAIFCETLADKTGAIVNPIEKGHPDLVPASARHATESQLRNFAEGLEVKTTIGNVEQGANLRAGTRRIKQLTGITWQAHHQEVRELMGLSWDFVQPKESFHSPAITGVFYAANLELTDWGAISGTTGRNTKVSGMRSSGKAKMGSGWVAMLDEADYLAAFQRMLGVNIRTRR